jgi:hypothetical protein
MDDKLFKVYDRKKVRTFHNEYSFLGVYQSLISFITDKCYYLFFCQCVSFSCVF